MRQPFVLVRLKMATRFWRIDDGRVLRHNGLHGNLHAVPLAEALRLVDGGRAKLLPHLRLDMLRGWVEGT